MTYFVRAIERLMRVGSIVAYVTLGCMVLLTVINVVTRRLEAPVPGTYSLICLMAVVAVSPAVAYTQLKKGHIVLDLLGKKFPRYLVSALDWLVVIISIGIWGLASYAALKYAYDMWVQLELLDPLDIPVAPFRLIWGIALAFFCLAVLASLFKKE